MTSVNPHQAQIDERPAIKLHNKGISSSIPQPAIKVAGDERLLKRLMEQEKYLDSQLKLLELKYNEINP